MKNSRILSVFLAAVLLFCAVTPAFAADDYTDVKENRWSRAAVMYVTEKGYMNGVSDGKFDHAFVHLFTEKKSDRRVFVWLADKFIQC